jgi:hypothetical protein
MLGRRIGKRVELLHTIRDFYAIRTFYDMDEETKRCHGRCGEERPLTDFNLSGMLKVRTGTLYRDARCKTCHREEKRDQRLRYKIADPRPPACECCSRAGKTHLDHSKVTELIRGWLCTRCNTGIGELGDTLVRLHKALVYLILFLDRTGLSEEETRSPFMNVAKGCCRRCGEQREEDDFCVNKKSSVRDYRKNTCRACVAKAERQKRRLAKLVGPPAHACDICRREGPTELDHCHVSGAFRGWLCHKCNTGLGKLGDDIAGVRRAIAYLLRSFTRASGSPPEERAQSRSPRNHGDSRGAAAAPESL